MPPAKADLSDGSSGARFRMRVGLDCQLENPLGDLFDFWIQPYAFRTALPLLREYDGASAIVSQIDNRRTGN